MKIIIGSDHAGFDLKEALKPFLVELGHEVVDVGTHSTDSVDYPDIARAVAVALTEETADPKSDRGILICGSGVGVSVAANKFNGIRAGLCHDTYSAHQGVEHDNMNVLVLGSRIIGSELARDLVRNFLNAQFTDEPRHRRRLIKLRTLKPNSRKT